ncbi:uncharacterized protein JF75_05640 [Lactobacillus kimbladii]|uniref:Nitroreductase domain-containing protein n=1 Tax=Lactobacillus kimbladii TaxID=1218506 RepID=A0A0F4LJL1_9LACO|nr:SagB/ThcOx family dehydrogenase [Lactobacillus kimbladii]KJY59032.1 uncharacterized protein JF75_05640 [Lactobacillus kimbladii]
MEKYNDSCELTRSGVPLFRLFHNETSLSNNTSASFDASIQNAFDDENFMHEVLNQCKKRKKSLGGISLDKVEVPNNSLFECLAKRRSCRDFSKESVSFKKLSAILFFSYGLVSGKGCTVPSAGGAYPIKLIVCCNKVDGIAKGMYQYSFQRNELTLLSNNIDYNKITGSKEYAINCAFSIHFIASPVLQCYKYQDRGYRFMTLECGHIAQNLSLVSEYYGIGSVCSGGYLDGEFINFIESIKNLGCYKEDMYLYEMFFGYPLHIN